MTVFVKAKNHRPAVAMICGERFWTGRARLPARLHARGFTVHVFCLREDYIARSRYAATVHPLRSFRGLVLRSEAGRIRRALEKLQPDFIIPGDENGLLLVAAMVSRATPVLRNTVQRSLGDPAFLVHLLNKNNFISAAAAAGFRVPGSVPLPSGGRLPVLLEQAEYPLVLKGEWGSGGRAVHLCRDLRAAAQVWQNHQPTAAGGLRRFIKHALFTETGPNRRLLMQPLHQGRESMFVFLADKGRILSSLLAEKVAAHPWPRGPSTVVQVYDDPGLTARLGQLVARLGLTGFGGIDFILPAGSRQPVLLELNPRPVPLVTWSFCAGVDMARVLKDHLDGQPCRQDKVRPGPVVFFPAEYRREPASPWLQGTGHDVPVDDPDLLHAMCPGYGLPTDAPASSDKYEQGSKTNRLAGEKNSATKNPYLFSKKSGVKRPFHSDDRPRAGRGTDADTPALQ